MIVRDIMTGNVITALPSDSIESIINTMTSENIGAVPVCDSSRHILGIITDRDIITRWRFGSTAEEIMSKNPVFVPSDTDIHQAGLVMSEHKVRRLLVSDNEKLSGILTLHDFAKKRVLISQIGHIIFNLSNPL